MSYVTSLLLHMSMIEDGETRIAEVNAHFSNADRYSIPDNPLVGLHTQELPRNWYGGSKSLQCHVYVGAYNYFNLAAFQKHLSTIKWDYPEEVQLFVKDEHDEKFQLMQGVMEFDERFTERDRLLWDAEYVMETLSLLIKHVSNSTEFNEIAGDVSHWLEEYQQFKKSE